MYTSGLPSGHPSCKQWRGGSGALLTWATVRFYHVLAAIHSAPPSLMWIRKGVFFTVEPFSEDILLREGIIAPSPVPRLRPCECLMRGGRVDCASGLAMYLEPQIATPRFTCVGGLQRVAVFSAVSITYF